MSTCYRYFWAVGIFTAASVVAGALLGLILRGFSMEYLYVVRAIPYDALFAGVNQAVYYGLHKGLRGGFFLGAIMGFAAVGGARQSAPVKKLLIALAVVAAAILAAAMTGAAGVYIAAKVFGPFLPTNIAMQVGSPYRVLCGYGLEIGAQAGALLATLAVGAWLWRQRQPLLESTEFDSKTASCGHGSDS